MTWPWLQRARQTLPRPLAAKANAATCGSFATFRFFPHANRLGTKQDSKHKSIPLSQHMTARLATCLIWYPTALFASQYSR